MIMMTFRFFVLCIERSEFKWIVTMSKLNAVVKLDIWCYCCHRFHFMQTKHFFYYYSSTMFHYYNYIIIVACWRFCVWHVACRQTYIWINDNIISYSIKAVVDIAAYWPACWLFHWINGKKLTGLILGEHTADCRRKGSYK